MNACTATTLKLNLLLDDDYVKINKGVEDQCDHYRFERNESKSQMLLTVN
jgi:hypothetical protein